jgi:hypothetical protein
MEALFYPILPKQRINTIFLKKIQVAACAFNILLRINFTKKAPWRQTWGEVGIGGRSKNDKRT